MSCPGCLPSMQERERQLLSLRVKAKEYAVEHQKPVIIYLTETMEYNFMEAEAATRIGITGEYISEL